MANEIELEDEFDLDDDGEFDGPGPERLALIQEGERIQALVRGRVEPKTWEVFWRVAIEERTIAETAASLGMTYTGAFAAYSRVDRRLREEGRRRLALFRIPHQDVR